MGLSPTPSTCEHTKFCLETSAGFPRTSPAFAPPIWLAWLTLSEIILNGHKPKSDGINSQSITVTFVLAPQFCYILFGMSSPFSRNKRILSRKSSKESAAFQMQQSLKFYTPTSTGLILESNSYFQHLKLVKEKATSLMKFLFAFQEQYCTCNLLFSFY